MTVKQSEPAEAGKKENENHGEISSFRIIGIGASAGGLEALKVFFDHIPTGFPHSIVIIQHLSPDHKSYMSDLLSRTTEMPVQEAGDKTKVEPGKGYLIPPSKTLTVEKGVLNLTDRPKGILHLPIDIFFKSLADDMGSRAVGIIMSGTGTDGTIGSRFIKEAGGIVMIQTPETAQFDGMPKSAISTGLADYIMPVGQMPEELSDLIDHPPNNQDNIEIVLEKDEETLSRLLDHIHNLTEVDFSWYKRSTLIRRIANRMSILKCRTLPDYLGFLYQNPHEARVLSRQFLIGVTRFFRDQEAWKVLEEKVIPELIKRKPVGQPFKVWSVGCCTGEEVYSMAILLKEQMEKLHKPLEVKIFATDLEQSYLDIAAKGVYPESIAADVPPGILTKYFTKTGNEYRVTEEIRKMAIFSRHNALEDPPLNKMDIVCCRNVLIYFQPVMQKKLISVLHYALNFNGVLFLGSSENLVDMKEAFLEIDRKWRIFYNRQVARTIGPEYMRFPDVQRSYYGPHTLGWASAPKTSIENRLSEILNDILMEEFAVACVYVDENFEVLHATGNFKQYMELPEHRFSLNLLKMVPENLAVAMNAAMRKAEKEKGKVLYKDVRLRKNGQIHTFSLLVKPFELEAVNDKLYYLIAFKEELVRKETERELKEQDNGNRDYRHVNELEEQLRDTRENLQSTLEEVETSNEELQVTNEELMAANEELQSTNEELQSVNEELHTVNTEYQQKIEELADLNADMDNLLKNTDIGTIFLDKDLRIRKFTPAIREHFNLIDSDIGRPINHFTSNFGEEYNKELLGEIDQVLKNNQRFQTEILNNNTNKWYLKNVLPFVNADSKVEGVVITFTDISYSRKVQEELRQSEERYHKLVAEVHDYAIILLDPEGYIETWNKGAMKIQGYEDKEITGQHFSAFFTKEDRHDKLPEKIIDQAKNRGRSEYEGWWIRKDKALFWSNTVLTALYDDDGKLTGFSCVTRDLTQQKDMEEKLRKQAKKAE